MLSTVLLALAIAPTASGSYVIIPQQVEHNGITYEVTTQNSKLIAIPLNEIKPPVKPAIKSKPQVVAQKEVPEGDYYSQIQYWCSHYGCNSKTLYNRMMCESTGKANARNGIYVGLYQYGAKTFYAYAARTAIVNPNINNPTHQIQLATYMDSIGESYHWPNC